MINVGVSPQNCSICYQPYNNERSPLILITCGHTFCKECVEMIFLHDSKEIPCPECKQSTYVLEPKALPKNRALLDVIIFNEEINRNTKRGLNLNTNQNKNTHNQQIQQNQNEENNSQKNEKSQSGNNFSFKLPNPNDKNEILLNDYAHILNKLEETYNKILEDHSYLTEISDVLITKEVDEALDSLIDIVNEYRITLHNRIKNEFEKVNLIKDFKNSLGGYKMKLNIYSNKLLQKERKNSEVIVQEENCEIKENEQNVDEINLTNTNKNSPLKNSQDEYSLTQFEIDNLSNEIKFAELYAITLKHYSKEIYNPCKYFFINKFQIDKLTEDLRKLLQKICDFDENVFKYSLENINTPDEKKILKEIQESCIQSNYRKLKFIFTHLRINPNFIYSDVLDHITYQTINEGNFNNNSNNVNVVGNSLTINLAGSGGGNVGGGSGLNQVNSNLGMISSPGIFSNTTNTTNNQGTSNLSRGVSSSTNPMIRLNNGNRLQTSSFISNMNFKDKITNLYTYLKNFKDKNELNEFLKFLIDEYNYLPFKIEADTSVEIKFGRDFEWKINLNLV